MSWFDYDYSYKGEKREHRKGVWLRWRMCSDVEKAIKKSKCLRLFDRIEWVIVKELRPNQEVVLQVWAKNWKDAVKPLKNDQRWRYNVFYLLLKENSDWVCEGDLGRGHVSSKQKNK